MVEFKKTPDKKEDLLRILNPVVRDWFFSRFKEFSLPQLFAVKEIHSRNNVLVSAPTGATKTLTGFLSVLNELVDSSQKGVLKDKTYCIYISPLKALNNDIQKNLREPLAEIEQIYGKKLNIRVGVRTGDTTQSEKQAMLKHPPHILITTPESLAIMLSSVKFVEHLKSVEWMVIDEVHALAENKRGVHLSLLMENIQHINDHICRVGLSATVAPLEDVAQFLVGTERSCKIVDVQFIKQLDLKVLSPVDDLINTDYNELHNKQYELLNKLIQEHKTTLIFTNTRAATERVVHYLKDRYPKNYAEITEDPEDVKGIGAHHGSLSKEHRLRIENSLREGKLRCVVCSTSLELGLDIGYIDLVILLGSPKSVARMLQRIGRSGHQLHSTTKGRIVVLDRDDLVECSVMLKNAMEKKIDRLHIPENALDVLAQVIVGFALQQVWDEKELFKLIKKSYCYRNLSWKDYNEILEYLAGNFVSLEERYIFGKIWRKDNSIGRKGKLGRVIYMTNIGTIPDNSFVLVKIGEHVVGKIDEAFLERLRPGDVFVLGGETYRFKFARGLVAQVETSVNRPPTVPSWYSDTLPLSFDLALEIGKFRRLMQQKLNKGSSKKEVVDWILSYLYVDDKAANAIYNYFKEQYDFLGIIPTDKKIVLENYTDESESKIIFHSLFGRRVNECLSRAIGFAVSRTQHRNVEIGVNDNGFYVASNRPINIIRVIELLKSEKLDLVLDAAIDNSEVFKRRFRHCAARALMILRNYKGHTKNVGRQQVSSMILMAALRRISPDFSILKEAKREVLHDLMDIDHTKEIFKLIEEKKISIEEVNTRIPSPFAFLIALQGHIDVLKMEDRIEFLKRMHQLVLGKIALDKGKKQEGVDAEKYLDFSIKEYIKKAFANKEEITPLQKALLSQLDRVSRVPRSAKLDLMYVIKGKEMSPGMVEKIRQYKSDIQKNWPKELAKFVISKAENPDFSYEDLWDKEERDKEEKKLLDIEDLKLDLKKAVSRSKIDSQIAYDLFNMVDGEKEGFRKETFDWMKKFLKGTIPKYWSDKIVKFLKKKAKELS